MPNIFLYSVQYNCILTYTSNVYMHVYICVYISKHIHMHMYMFIWESHTCLWLNRIHLLGICYAISNLKDEQIMDMGLFLLFSSQIKHSQWGRYYIWNFVLVYMFISFWWGVFPLQSKMFFLSLLLFFFLVFLIILGN